MTVSEVERPTVTSLLPAYLTEFAAALPSHIRPESFVQMAVAALRRDQHLREAAEVNPASLIYALREAARMGLEPGTEQYYLTPRKEKGSLKVLGIVGYQGHIERMYRAGAVSSVIAETVHRNDDFTYLPGRDERPIHEIDWFADDRGPLVLAYAYAVMRDGATSKIVIVNKARIERAKKASPTAGSTYSPWLTDEVAMWLKTAAHDLEKWVPTSSEYLRERLRIAQEVQAETPARPAAEPQPVSGEVPDEVEDAVDAEIVVEEMPEWPEVTLPGTAVPEKGRNQP